MRLWPIRPTVAEAKQLHCSAAIVLRVGVVLKDFQPFVDVCERAWGLLSCVMKDARLGGVMGDLTQEPQARAAGSIEVSDPVAAFIIQRIEMLEFKIETFRELAEEHWTDEAKRFRLIDQFLSPAMEIESLIKQLGELGRNQNQKIVEMQTTIERELRAMRDAVRLAVSTGGLETQTQARDN
jgi:hypothetical protein